MTRVRSSRGLAAPAVNPSPTSRPRLSIVVASRRERSQVELCLTTLLPAAVEAGAEVIVARAGNDAPFVTQAWEGVEVVWCDAGTTASELLGIGMSRATGHVVLLTEDHWIGAAWWAETLRDRAGRAPEAMQAAALEAVDWAARLQGGGVPRPGIA